MRRSAHPARRVAAIIGLISAMLLTGGADRVVPGSRAAERATGTTGEVREEAAGRDEASGRDEGSGRDEALEAVEDRSDGRRDEDTDAVDDTVDETTDTVNEAVTDTTETVDDTVDHTTDAVDDAVGHTTGIADELVDDSTDTLDSLSGDDQNAHSSPPIEELPPPADGAPSPADGEPPSPLEAILPIAAAPSGQSPEGALPGEEDAETGDPTNGFASPDLDEPGSLFNGNGGIGERAPFPLALVLILAGFLGVQAWVDRRDPKLAAAPLETEPDLVFERP